MRKIKSMTFDGLPYTYVVDNMPSVTPEQYGAVGDGITNDAEAITQALANSKHVTFDGTKTYAIGSPIIIPADAYVDFCWATVVPLGNHDVIQVKPGSHIENLVVRCADVEGWNSSAIVLYGGDRFRAINPTKISNVKLYNNTSNTAGLTTLGTGFKLYGDNFGDFIEGVTIEEAMTHGFGIGMLFVGVDDYLENPTGGLIFIGANKFRGYWSFYDNCAISMPSKFPNTHITNNIFTDLQIEPKNTPDKEKQSSYGIYCEGGFTNYFEGCLYDYFYEHTAVYFGTGSNTNVVKSTSGTLYRTENPVWYKDLGAFNTITTIYGENTHLVPNTAIRPCINGNQDDYFAFIDKRANCTLESLDGNPVSGRLANVFNPSPDKTLKYRTVDPDANNRRARITINCNVAMRRLSNLYLQFYSAPKSIKVTFYNNKDAVVVYGTNNNTNKLVGITSYHPFGDDIEYGVAKIVIELGGFNSVTQNGAETFGEWELVRILAVNSYASGNTWLRCDGGELYGNVKFVLGTGIVLTAKNGKKFMLSVSDTGILSTSEYIEQEEEEPEVAVLTPTMLPQATWYDTELAGAEQSTITSVTFNSSYESTGNEDARWACDEDRNGNIMAYRNGTEVIIKSTTGSEGVKLNQDSSYMFANDGTNANFSSLISISGTETWKADKNTNMSHVCRENRNLINPICVPSGVTNLTRAFMDCYALTNPPVLPEGLVNLNTTFSNCIGMQCLPEIPNTVTNMNYTFANCNKATKAPSVIPAKVTSMECTFRLCVALEGTIEVNAVNIGNYTKCFDTTGRDGTGITLTGTNTQLAELAATNTIGKVTVA